MESVSWLPLNDLTGGELASVPKSDKKCHFPLKPLYLSRPTVHFTVGMLDCSSL